MTKNDNPNVGAVILDGRQLILWSLAVAFFGVFFAIPLRKQTIIRERLKFPSGTATAQMISLLHQQPDPTVTKTTLRRRRPLNDERRPLIQPTSQQPTTYTTTHTSAAATALSADDHNDEDFELSWALKLRGLIVSFIASSIYTLTSYFVPIVNTLPIFNWITFNLIDFRAWEWYFTPSFSYIGQGIIMGLPTTLSMLLGCVIGWGILSPVAVYCGWAPGPIDDWKTGSKGWILWISLGVMIAESCVSLLVVLVRTIVKAWRQKLNVNVVDYTPLVAEGEARLGEEFIEDEIEVEEVDSPVNQQVSKAVTVVGLIVSSIACVYLVGVVFPNVIPAKMTLLAIAVAMFLSILGVRALGETDLNPVSGIGKLAQLFYAGVMPGGILANLIAGGIAEAGAQQAGDLMQDLKTGHLLKASPKAQFYGQMIGSFASVFIATGKFPFSPRVSLLYQQNLTWLFFNHRCLSFI